MAYVYPWRNENSAKSSNVYQTVNPSKRWADRRLKANETIAIPVKDILAAFERKYRVNARQEIVAGVPARWQEPGGNAELRIGSVNEFSPRRWRWRDGIRIEVVTARLEAAIVVTDFQLDPLRNQAWRYGIIIMRASSMLYFLQNLFPEMNSALYFEMEIFFWMKDNYEGNSLKIAFFFFRSLNSF